MIEHIASLIREEVGEKVNIEISPDTQHLSKFGEFTGINFVISNLSDAVSLPLRVRRILYASSDDKLNDLDKYTEFMIESARLIMVREIGEEESDKWATELDLRINNILAGSGPMGIFSGSKSLIIEDSKEESNEVTQTLQFRFQNGIRKIAERTYTYMDGKPKLYDKYKSEPGYEKLLDSIQKLIKNSVTIENHKFHHLFIWSDLPPTNFQPSFLERVVVDYVRRFRGHHKHTAKILLFSSISHKGKGASNKNLNSTEILALQRGFGGGILYLAPGKNEDLKSDKKKKFNRRMSVYDSTSFTQSLGARFDELDISQLRIFDGLRDVLHEGTSDLVDKSAFAIVSDCWTGTWAETKEIDGEQVMT